LSLKLASRQKTSGAISRMATQRSTIRPTILLRKGFALSKRTINRKIGKKDTPLLFTKYIRARPNPTNT